MSTVACYQCAHRVRVLSHWLCAGGGRYVPGSAAAGNLPSLGGGSGFDSDPLTGTAINYLFVLLIVYLFISLICIFSSSSPVPKGGSRYVPPMEPSNVSVSVHFEWGCPGICALPCMCLTHRTNPKSPSHKASQVKFQQVDPILTTPW